jgi:hypothetical protein
MFVKFGKIIKKINRFKTFSAKDEIAKTKLSGRRAS